MEKTSDAKNSTESSNDLEYLQIKAYDALTDYYMKGQNGEESEFILEELGKISGIETNISKGTITYNGKTYDVSEILGNTNEQKAIESNGVKQVTISNANDEEKELLE